MIVTWGSGGQSYLHPIERDMIEALDVAGDLKPPIRVSVGTVREADGTLWLDMIDGYTRILGTVEALAEPEIELRFEEELTDEEQ